MDNDDVLSAMAAAVVSELRYEGFLLELYSRPPGQWAIVGELPGPVAAAASYGGLQKELTLSDVMATWLPSPYPEHSGFCVVLFFCPATVWGFTAYHYKAMLERKRGLPTDRED